MATVTFEIDDKELWSEVMGGAWEFCSWWRDVDYVVGEWDEPGEVWVVVEDPGLNPWALIEEWGVTYLDEIPEEEWTASARITIEDIARAIGELRDHASVMEALSGTGFDQISSDVVLQQAIFGEVVFG